MPFNMFKAFSGSRNRPHRGDPAVYSDEYPQGYPPGPEFQPEPTVPGRSQPQMLRRSNTATRREPLFTPLPSRAPTDAEEYHEGFVRVDNPDAVMGGALNARPGRMPVETHPSIVGDSLGSPLSDTLSEREHRESLGRIHDPSRLLDRPPPLQRSGSYHSGRGDKPLDPGEPIIMRSSPDSVSGSDHTVEALRAPHPNERVIPPLPRHYSGSYVPGLRSPTDIYGDRQYDGDDMYSHHSGAYGGGYGGRYGRSGHNAQDTGPIYYVIPGGMNVIFQDEQGNEITRVGDFSGRSRPTRPGPFVIQDEHGRELYRYDGVSHGRGHSDPPIVRIDAYPTSSRFGRERSYSSHSYHSDPSYRRGYDSHPDPRDHSEKSWRDPRDNRYQGRGYSDYSDYGEHRDRGGYRDLGHRDHGGHRGYGEYREHGNYKSHGGADVHIPGRVSSRASHRSYSRASQMSPERLLAQYPDALDAIPDDRRSGQGRDYAHPSVHQIDEPDISEGMQALHM